MQPDDGISWVLFSSNGGYHQAWVNLQNAAWSDLDSVKAYAHNHTHQFELQRTWIAQLLKRDYDAQVIDDVFDRRVRFPNQESLVQFLLTWS
jgi:hypothetical protein